jgi:hypothetical protein
MVVRDRREAILNTVRFVIVDCHRRFRHRPKNSA